MLYHVAVSGGRAMRAHTRALVRAAMIALSSVIIAAPALADGPGMATTWRSNGDGTFAMDFHNPWAGYSFPNGLWLVADINGNGRDDIVHAVHASDYVHPWSSNGDGTFSVTSFSPWAGYAIPNGLWLVADVNGDGRDDIVHAVKSTNYVHTWMSNGDGTFAVGTFSPWPGYAIPNGLWLVADIDGDGRDDIVHAVKGTDYAHTWISNGDGTFTVGTFSPWPGYAIPNGDWMVADIDGDDRDDIVHAVKGADYVHTWMSNGDGTFTVGTFSPWAGYQNARTGRWLVVDFTGDGRDDIVHVFEIERRFALPVSRHNSTTIDNHDADRILDDATAILLQSDGADDLACDTRLHRNGNVGVFHEGTGTINSQADYNAVLGLDGYVKVVNQINWCGTLAPHIIGCAPVPGNSLLVVRFTGSQEGVLWAHEYGHTQGLWHRTSSNAVMNPTIGSTRTRVDTSECDAFR